jgi:heat shock protein HtpX
VTLQQQIRANRLRTALVVGAFFLLIAVLAAAVWGFVGQAGGIGVLAFGIAYALFAWWNAGRMVGGLTHAQPIEKRDDPELYRMIENVGIAAGLARTPPLYLVEDPAPNAFAAGVRPSTVYVAVTTGLRRLMSPRELEAVLAHEISHIRNRDVRLMTLAAVLVGVVAMISDIAFRMALFGGGRRSKDTNPLVVIAAVVALLLAPVAAMLLQMALSRRREFLADASAAAILNDPEAMALALRRLQLDTQETRYADRSTAHLFIESPARAVRGAGGFLAGLFQTHPPLEERIAALEEAGGFRLSPLDPVGRTGGA